MVASYPVYIESDENGMASYAKMLYLIELLPQTHPGPSVYVATSWI